MLRKGQSIAVIPFVNMSADSENDFFCDGLTEEIINSLASIRQAQVTSCTSSFFFKNKRVDLVTIADQLRVKYLVEGSVRVLGDQTRITVQLINAIEDYHYWSQSFDYKGENIFFIQDDIAIKVKEKFREIIGHFDISSDFEESRAERSVEAYEKILRAKQHATDLTEKGVSKGLKLIENAIELEPNNVNFLSIKATYLTALGIMGAMPRLAAAEMATNTCNQAILIDPEHPETHAILGHLAFLNEGNLDKFYYHVNKALYKRPNEEITQYIISIVESAVGNYEKSMAAVNRSFDINPISRLPDYFRIINLMRLGKYEESMAFANEFLEKYPWHINAYNVKGLLFLRLNEPEKAISHFEKMPLPNGTFKPYYGGIAMAYALQGNEEKANEYVNLAKIHDSDLHLSYFENPQVVVDFILGKPEEGFKELQIDIGKKEWYVRFYKTIPFFKPYLDHPQAKIFSQALILPTSKNMLKAKYAKSGLKRKEISIINEKLHIYLEEEKAYLRPDLSLNQLAEELEVNPNHLSQVINSQKNKNFFDFINTYRIKELLDKLKEPENKKFTILSLALESGFNSKSTFQASFKKLTGMTPSDYLKSVEVFK